MKKERKKAQRQDTAPNHNQSYLSRFEWVCLILFLIFFITLIAGYITDNIAMRFFGAGVGFATLLITTDFNLNTEDE